MSVEHSEFQSLLDELTELDTLRKARAADAEPKSKPKPKPEPEEPDPDFEEYEDADDDEDDPEDEDDAPRRKPLGKSFAVTLDDGSQVEAMDGTEVIAALQADVAAIGSDMQKALRALVGYTKTQASELDTLRKSHANELHALREEVTALGQRPRGRKSVVNLHEPRTAPDLDVGHDASAMDGPAILAKAATMNLDPVTMAVLCELVNTRQPLPAHLAKAFQ